MSPVPRPCAEDRKADSASRHRHRAAVAEVTLGEAAESSDASNLASFTNANFVAQYYPIREKGFFVLGGLGFGAVQLESESGSTIVLFPHAFPARLPRTVYPHGFPARF